MDVAQARDRSVHQPLRAPERRPVEEGVPERRPERSGLEIAEEKFRHSRVKLHHHAYAPEHIRPDAKAESDDLDHEQRDRPDLPRVVNVHRPDGPAADHRHGDSDGARHAGLHVRAGLEAESEGLRTAGRKRETPRQERRARRGGGSVRNERRRKGELRRKRRGGGWFSCFTIGTFLVV